MANLNYKLQILEENKGDLSLKEYVEMNAESDPMFFRWLFGKDFENDFDSSMTDEEKIEYQQFLETL